MTSVVSRVPAVLAYLVTLFANDPTVGHATPPVTVLDGPSLTATEPGLVLWVGLDDPDNTSAPVAADSVRAWAGLGGQSEVITVYCVAESWSGGDDMPTERASVYGAVSAVEVLVRGDRTQFGGTAMLADPGVTGSQLRQNATDTGAQARVSFQIVLKAL